MSTWRTVEFTESLLNEVPTSDIPDTLRLLEVKQILEFFAYFCKTFL